MYDNIRVEATRQNMNIRKLAIKANIKPCDLYSVLTGNRPFYPGWRKRVSEALGIPEAELFKDN